MTNEELNNFVEVFYTIKAESKAATFGFADDWQTFIKKMILLSPKSYGTKIQNRVMDKNGLCAVSASANKGDCEKNDKYYEIKTTILTPTNKNANITGVREWQEITGYLIFIIDARKLAKIETYSFYLTKEQLNDEKSKGITFSDLNGTKEANQNNKKNAKRFGFSLNSEHFKRWYRDYSIDLNNAESLIQTL
jgi:hypothetical protein